MKRLAVICARGGSKGVKGKNFRLLAGKPLIAHTIERAYDSNVFDHVAVSSDSNQILDIARKWGVEHVIKRPTELATDRAPKVPAIRHCAKTAEEALGVTFDIIVDLDVTAPLRSIEDISGAIQLLEDSGAPNVVTGMPASKSPYFNLVERDGQGRVRLSKTSKKTYASRQELPECFALNASVFAWTREALFLDYDFVLHDKTLLYVMPEERSLDIDSELEFRFVEFLMAAQEPTP